MRLIDADALIEALLEARHEETETALKLERFIRKQPTVEQKAEGLSVFEESVQADRAACVYVPIEPKRGRWEVVDYEEPRRYGCSECKRLVWHTENYCPNCGAKMEASDD